MTTRSAAYSKAKRHNAGTYRSGLEEKNSELLKAFSIEPHYEEQYLEYVVPQSTHKYTPDFVLPNGIIIETKGVWDAEDRKKHLLIREQHPELDIRFVFSRSKTYIYKGSSTTYASFCNKNGIKFADKLIPEEWLKEKPKDIPEGILKNKNNNNNNNNKRINK